MKKQTSERHSTTWDWSDLVGLNDDFNRVVALFHEGRLPQTLLFTGREGLGKTQFLSKLAAAFLCQEGQACGVCSSCQDVAHGRHDEVLFLETQKHYKVEHAASIHEHLSIQAASQMVAGKLRVLPRIVLMPNLDRLNTQGANRLLKVLEEPPGNCMILFSTSRPKQLLETLLSRLIRLHLQPPSLEESLGFLRRQLGQQIPETILLDVLAQVGMSPLKALTRLQDSSVEEHRELDRLVAELLFAGHESLSLEAVKSLMKDHKLPIDDLMRRIELSLNRYYRWYLLQEQNQASGYLTQNRVRLALSTLRQWRRHLSKVRLLASRKGIPLNGQMIAESFALSR